MLPRSGGADILTDMQMALWPADTVRWEHLKDGRSPTASTLPHRFQDAQPQVTIIYDAVPRLVRACDDAKSAIRLPARRSVPRRPSRSRISTSSALCAIGTSHAEVARRLFAGDCGADRPLFGYQPVGTRLRAFARTDDWPVEMRNRNNQLAFVAAEQLRGNRGGGRSIWCRRVVVTSTTSAARAKAIRAYVDSKRCRYAF